MAYSKVDRSVIEELFSQSYQVIISTHIWHLQTRGYAEHMALATIYDGLPDMLDSIVECWQGKAGARIQGPTAISIVPMSQKENHLSKFCEFIDETLNKLKDDLDLQDLVLDIANLMNKAKYLFTLS